MSAAQGLVSRTRDALNSRTSVIVYRVLLVLLALSLAHDSRTAFALLQSDMVHFGTGIWFAFAFSSALSVLGVICLGLMGLKWPWAVWAWAVGALGILLGGIYIGLNSIIVAEWEAWLPWIVVACCLFLGNRYAMPWKVQPPGILSWAGIGLTVAACAAILLLCKQIWSDTSSISEQLAESIARENARLPRMVNSELRLDRIAIKDDEYFQYYTFPNRTAADLDAEYGINALTDHYAGVVEAQICAAAACQQRLADGARCDAEVHFEMADMNDETFINITVDGLNCKVAGR